LQLCFRHGCIVFYFVVDVNAKISISGKLLAKKGFR
jgi:hypothetical protein